MTVDKIKDLKVYPLLSKEEPDTIRLSIIRHGETSITNEDYSGTSRHTFERAKEQSKQLNKVLINAVSETEVIFLSKENIDAIYTSDLKRCLNL